MPSFEILVSGFSDMLSTAGVRLLCAYIKFCICSPVEAVYLNIDTVPLAIMSQRPHMKANCSGFRRNCEQRVVNRAGGSGRGSRRAARAGSPACRGLQRCPVENLPVIRYLKTASSCIRVRDLNSDPPLCLQFYTSQLLAAFSFDFYNILFSMLVCVAV